MDAFEQQRMTMVESQLRPNEVTDKALLAAMGRVPRERFVPETLCGFAYMDETIEVWPASEHGVARFLLSPLVQARLVQLAEITAQDAVLDVGCATGYSTAILASLARHVTGVEPEPVLAETARANLKTVGATNTDIAEVSFEKPLAAQRSFHARFHGRFNAIVVEGSVCATPVLLLDALKDGGRLVTVLTETPNAWWGRACVFLRVEDMVSEVRRFGASAPPLPGLLPKSSFAF